jgi:uncharacterized protein YecE (DUF72 family)
MEVRVGLCGFTMSMQDYPRHFPVVEVQSTFYEPPRDAVITKWPRVTDGAKGAKGTEGTTPPLEYTMKVWQTVTHPANSPTYRRMKRALSPKDEPGFFRDSPIVEEAWQRSLECARLISASAMLFQCPASFTPEPENVARMPSFFARIKRPPSSFS